MGVTSPLPPSKGEMQRTNIHEQYDIGTGGRVGKARKAERTGTSGTSGTSETSGTGETSETGGRASRTGDCGTSGTSETSGRASQSQRMHGAGYVEAIMGQVRRVGYCAKKLC